MSKFIDQDEVLVNKYARYSRQVHSLTIWFRRNIRREVSKRNISTNKARTFTDFSLILLGHFYLTQFSLFVRYLFPWTLSGFVI